MQKQKITIIGSGNVATHLAHMLKQAGFIISEICSKTLENAKSLANQVDAQGISNSSELNTNSDIYIISVSDGAIQNIVNSINFKPKLIVHTAGSIAMSALKKFKNYGVLYPYQTFTKGLKIKSEVPFCIEANTAQNLKSIENIANTLSNKVYHLDSDKRKQCHLAAIFACNFTNHLYAISEKLLLEKNIPFDVIKPLITETAQKAVQISPEQVQTGPAVRNDIETMNKHIEQLRSEDLEKLYSFVSASIINLKTKKT